MAKDILEFGISTDTPETKKTQESLGQMLMFPAKLASNFATHMAIYAWSFNQITQMVHTLYEWWEEKNKRITEQITEYTKLLQLSLSGMKDLVGINLPALQQADVDMAERLRMYPMQVAAMRKAVADIATPARVAGLLEPALEVKKAFPEISNEAIVAALKPLGPAFGVEDKDVAAIAAAIFRNVGARAPEIAGMMGRQAGGIAAYMGLEDFTYLAAFISAGGTPALRGGTELTSAVRSWSQQMNKPGAEAQLERLLGADVFEAGKVKNMDALRVAVAEAYQDPKKYQQVRRYLGTTMQSDRLLSRLAITGKRKAVAERMANDISISEDAREEARAYLAEGNFDDQAVTETKDAVAGIQKDAAHATLRQLHAAQDEIVTAGQAGEKLAEAAKLKRSPEEQARLWALNFLAGEGEKKEGLAATAKTQGYWFTQFQYSPLMNLELKDIMERGKQQGLTDEEIAVMMLANVHKWAYGKAGLKATFSLGLPGLLDKGLHPLRDPLYYEWGMLEQYQQGGELPSTFLDVLNQALPSMTNKVKATAHVETQVNYFHAGTASEQAALRSGAGAWHPIGGIWQTGLSSLNLAPLGH